MTQAVNIPSEGIQLSGVIYQLDLSKDKPSPGLIIVVLHEWHPYETRVVETLEGVSKSLTNEGYVVLGALAKILRGYFQTQVEKMIVVRSNLIKMSSNTVNWLAKQTGVNSEYLGVVGFSRGGSKIALLSASLTQQLKAVVAFYPVTNVDRWAETTSHEIIRDWYIPEICARGCRHPG